MENNENIRMKPEDLGFDVYAFVKPKNHQDFMALSREVLDNMETLRNEIRKLRLDKK
jgi:hypothetical protein